MRNVVRIFFLLFAGLLLVGKLQAHDVVWWENQSGADTNNPMVFYYPQEAYDDDVGVDPEDYEPCLVDVYLDPPTSTLVDAAVLTDLPANSVDILVLILRAPSNHLETATITGYWEATGEPADEGCDGYDEFSIPIVVSDQEPKWQINLVTGELIDLNTGYPCALQYSDCPTGPWEIWGIGQKFRVPPEMTEGYFQRSKQTGGFVNGMITDPFGNPIPGIGLDLLYGGSPATFDSLGNFSFASRQPKGMNVYKITNPIGASLSVAAKVTNNTVVNYVVAMAAVTNPPPTNVCNCTPWCAIGYGTLPGGLTPVYYSGGANSPKSGAVGCDQPKVSVTPPSGKSFPIKSGSNRRQNSGPNPAAGTWTVTATVCGQIKTATVTVP